MGTSSGAYELNHEYVSNRTSTYDVLGLIMLLLAEYSAICS